MTNDEWTWQKAAKVYYEIPPMSSRLYIESKVATALQEAIERTREEERANAAKALKLAHEMQDKAVDAAVKRERAICKMEAEVAAIPSDEQEAMKARARPWAEIKAERERVVAKAVAAERERLEEIINSIDAALCNFLNGCSDPFSPVSQWDDESCRNYRVLCDAYNQWHKDNAEVSKISMAKYQKRKAAEAKLARLKNPDEAMVEALQLHFHGYAPEDVEHFLRRLASILTEREEGDDG